MAIVAEGSRALTILEMDGGIGGNSQGKQEPKTRTPAEKTGLSTTAAHARATDNLSALVVRFQVARRGALRPVRWRIVGSHRGENASDPARIGRLFWHAKGELTLT
jgi:hypothetical protein